MTTHARSITAIALAGATAACALPGQTFRVPSEPISEGRPRRTVTMPTGEAADEAFRASPPPRMASESKTYSTPLDRRLSNGIRLVMLERHDFPSVSTLLLLDRGAAAAAPGVGKTYAEAMLGDSAEYKAGEAFDYLNFVGGRVESFAYHDFLGVQTTALSPLAVSALSRTVPMFTSPELGSKDRERAHAAIKASRSSASDAPAVLAADTLSEMLFPAPHPYGVPVDGGAKRLTNGAIDDSLDAFREQNVTTEHVTAVVVGDFMPDAMQRAFEKLLGKVKKGAGAAGPAVKPPPPAKGGHVVIVDRPGAVQTNVAIGWPGPRADSDEVIPLDVLANATAGELSTRLNLHVRQELGATYGVTMSAYALRDGGTLTIRAAIDTARTVEAVKGMLGELERLEKEPLSDAELSAAKLRTHFDLEHGTAHGLARTLAYAIGKGLPPDYVTTFNRKVDALTAEDVRTAAGKRLRRDELRMVLVGDAAKLLDGVRALAIGDVVVQR
ncbi:MAG: insulinase family protein [Deltaproteobacteria bacterium]|nr:insulinase family protein [Deltaproteobacteria bacterium]